MIKAFLSHSSKDKESYVRIVANKLKKDMPSPIHAYPKRSLSLGMDERLMAFIYMHDGRETMDIHER